MPLLSNSSFHDRPFPSGKTETLVLGKSPEKVVERVVEKENNMTFLKFIADYWWLLFPLGAFLSWFLHSILPGIFG